MALERLTKTDPLQVGRFTVLARLGSGGMGVVYLGEDEHGVPVAIKVVRAELAADPVFRARFRREVEAGRRVGGRCTARFVDADTLAREPWLATEFVPGPTLHADVHRNGPYIGARLVALGVALADALVSIHGAGLVHRDLKPANVLLGPDLPRVIDFGIAVAEDATALTATGTLVGSPAYMSPEQAQGLADVGPAADVFAWASTMVFAARGTPPFGDGEAAGVLYRVVNDAPDLTGVDPVLLPYVEAALDKDAKRRPTASHVAEALAGLLPPAPAATPPATPGDPTVIPAVPPAVPPAAVHGAGAPDPAATSLLAAWSPPASPDRVDPEATLAEARLLREQLPPREAEVRRVERRRANRAIFVTALVAAVALAVVSAVFMRAAADNEVALSQAKERGQVPTTLAATDAEPGDQAGGGPTTTAAGGAPVAGGDEGGRGSAGGTGSGGDGGGVAPSTTVAPPPQPSAVPPTSRPADTCTVTVSPLPLAWSREYTVTIEWPSDAGTFRAEMVRVDPPAEVEPVAWSYTGNATFYTTSRFQLRYDPDQQKTPLQTRTHFERADQALVVQVRPNGPGRDVSCDSEALRTPASPPPGS